MKKLFASSLLMTAIFCVLIDGCSLFMNNDKLSEPSGTAITSLKLSKSTVSLGVGGMEYLTLTVNPAASSGSVTYQCNPEGIVSVDGDRNGVSLTGLKSGNTVLKAIAGNGVTTACVVGVSGIDPTIEKAPQITSSTIALELEQGVSKRVQVSLTGGSSADMAGFRWSIDKAAIAAVEGSGQTAYITAKTNGIAQVTVTHPSATYPYQFCVFVKPEAEKAVYITNNQPIITLDRNAGDKTVSVSLVNGDESDNSSFSWKVLSNSESDASCITIGGNGKDCLVTPLKQGTTFIEVTHPKSAYPYLIRCKIVTIVENVIIEPSVTKVTLEGTAPQSITAKLTGGSEPFNPSEFSWTTPTPELLELSAFQDSCGVQGKANGTGKLIISHPAAKYPREILVFVQNHPAGSVDGAMYITTAQDYIRTKVGADETILNIALAGGEIGDEKDFAWTIDKPDVITVETVHGTVAARSATTSRTAAQAAIKPKKEGTAVISITHPKTLVSKEVMIAVLPSSAMLEEPLYIVGSDVLGLVIGNRAELSMTLTGNVAAGDERNVTWESGDESIVSLSAVNGSNATINANAAGETFVTVTHPKAAYPKKLLVYTAATEEELAAKKILYTSKNRYNIVANGTPERLYVYALGISDTEISGIEWKNSNPAVTSITVGSSNKECIVSGIAAGTATITATHPECTKPVEFTVTVLPAGTDLGVVPSPTYLTTTQNVVQFTELNVSKTISITPIKLTVSEYRNIRWEAEDESVCEVVPNGDKATITSKKEGVTTIRVSHPESENVLPVTVRVGSQYVSPPVTTPYVSASQAVLGLVSGGSGQRITAELHNATSASAFNWHLDNTDIAEITPLNGSCFIVPKAAGQALLTISHPAAPGMDAKVLILVANSEEELAALPFLTTSQNVVSLKTGTQQNVQVRIANGDNPLPSGYTWKVVDNPTIVQIISSGSQAVLKGLSAGIAHIEVSHTGCKYPLPITVEVKDDTADATAYPFITNNQNIVTMTVGGASKSIGVTLTGGTVEDNTDFSWAYDRSDVIGMVSNGQNAVIRALAPGECLITVTHPKARYPYPIKVVVEQAATGPSLYVKTNPANIITMKPADPEQTVTASLVGGTAEDAYGFKWYADNYNVVDLTATANTAVITPRAEGTATITISHPKAAFPGELTVRVTEYSTFAFSMTNLSMTEGDTQFISMKVPAMEAEYGGRVTYRTDNEKIVSISGTNKVAQLTAIGTGTAIVSATSPSGAKSDMMVYVKKASEQTKPSITSNTNVLSMKVTDSQRSVSAQLVGQGVVPTDQYNLQWTIDNPAVVQLIGTSGPNILLRPLAAGETTLRITHEKTETIYTMYIEVTGTAGGIALNKNYMSLETGKTIELSATIDNGTTTDYNNITWSADKVGGQDIITVLGSGKTVAVYGLASGRTSVTAEWNGKSAKCDVVVEAARQFAFDTQTMRVQPGQTKTFHYTLIPDTADIQWFTNSNEYITYAVDPASKTVSITGIKEDPTGSLALTTLSGISQSMKASISITTSWDYKLNLGKTMIKAEPRYDATNPEKFVIPYDVNPANARIDVQISRDGIADYVVDTDKKQIILTPRGEGDAVLTVTAYNVDTSPNTAFPNMVRQCNLYFAYDKLSLVPSVISKSGSFSRYDKDSSILILGDGEAVEMNFSVAEPNVNWTVTSANIVKKDAKSPVALTAGSIEKSYKIKHPNDRLEYQYRITEGYSPIYYNGTYSYGSSGSTGSGGEYIPPGLTGGQWVDAALDNFYWHTETDSWNEWGKDYCNEYVLLAYRGVSNTAINVNTASPLGPYSGYKYVLVWSDNKESGVQGGFFGRKRRPDLDGKIYSVAAFESVPWYYSPGLTCKDLNNGNPTTADKRILSEHIGAVKEIIQNSAIVSSANTDQLELVVNHNGKTEKFVIPIYTETRGCTYNQK